jgi:hypothetical protein
LIGFRLRLGTPKARDDDHRHIGIGGQISAGQSYPPFPSPFRVLQWNEVVP